MAKPDPRRLTLDAYPHIFSMDTRFQDLDMLGHVNNVAMAAMFENARVKFNQHIGVAPPSEWVRRLVASLEISYLAEAHFPDPIVMASGIGRVGNSSWEVQSAAFQAERCVATCDTVIVMRGPDGAVPISSKLRASIGSFAMKHPSP